MTRSAICVLAWMAAAAAALSPPAAFAAQLSVHVSTPAIHVAPPKIQAPQPKIQLKTPQINTNNAASHLVVGGSHQTVTDKHSINAAGSIDKRNLTTVGAVPLAGGASSSNSASSAGGTSGAGGLSIAGGPSGYLSVFKPDGHSVASFKMPNGSSPLSFGELQGSPPSYSSFQMPNATGSGVTYYNVNLTSGQPLTTIGNLKSVQQSLQNDLDSMNEMSEVTSMRLQMAMDRHSQLVQTLSNMLKKIENTQSAIVQNMK